MNKREYLQSVARNLIVNGQLDQIEMAFSEDYVAHADGKKHHGHVFIKRWAKQLLSAIVSIKMEDVKFLAEDEQSVTWTRRFSGVHVKNLRGIPASNKKVVWNEMVVSRFEDDKIIEEWLVSDLAGKLMLKLGK